MATTTRSDDPPLETLASIGNPDLDDVNVVRLTGNRSYLPRGVPGSDKTPLAMHLLMEGVRRDEPLLHVTLSESKDELHGVAASHGWSPEGITIRELARTGIKP